MLVDFFFTLRKYQLKVSLRELLDLLRALDQQVVFANLQEFYFLSRTVLVKDESQYDKFDRAFSDYFDGVEQIDLFSKDIPDEWLRKALARIISEEDKQNLKGLGSLDDILNTLKKRLEEQKERHQGGNKWIGTGGTSPFGAHGYNPEGVRIDQGESRHRRAVKVWEERAFRNLDNQVEIGTRNIKVALRKLREFARTGAAEQIDLKQTIDATAKSGGWLDIKMQPERHNAVKVLVFFDVGGSMDDHVKVCEQLFSAIHTEFKHLRFFYFHNCLYEFVWQNNERRRHELVETYDLLHTFSSDYKVIFVGDATMGPYEILYQGGSTEHWNHETGAVWMTRVMEHYHRVVWLNPQPQELWQRYASIGVMQDLVNNKMFPLTLSGLSDAISSLSS